TKAPGLQGVRADHLPGEHRVTAVQLDGVAVALLEVGPDQTRVDHGVHHAAGDAEPREHLAEDLEVVADDVMAADVALHQETDAVLNRPVPPSGGAVGVAALAEPQIAARGAVVDVQTVYDRQL